MTDQRNRTPPAPPTEEDRGVSTLLPMLVGGLALITIGMIAVALIV